MKTRNHPIFLKLPVMIFALVLYFLCGGAETAHAARRIVVKAPPGEVTVVSIPPAHRIIRVGRTRYHFHDGVYYLKKPKGYVVVEAPRGAVVAGIPRGCRRVRVGGRLYYSWAGAWYQKAPGGVCRGPGTRGIFGDRPCTRL